MTRPDPFQSAHWHAIAREAKLVRELIGAGVTALGRANYADGKGNYYVGLFGLSIGIERLSKMILVADFIVENCGQLPKESEVRKYGHKIESLLDACERVSNKHKLKLRYKRPNDEISQSIIDCLDCFSDAQKGRYANFQSLGDPNFQAEFEPIRRWWTNVAEKILQKHYRGTARERKVKANARQVDEVMGSYASVLFFSEDGDVINDVRTASERTGQAKSIQKMSRYYALGIVRWLSDIFESLTRLACYDKGMDILFGHYEHFQTYRVDDSFLKSRKVWPLR